jgi:hypothetical protein
VIVRVIKVELIERVRHATTAATATAAWKRSRRGKGGRNGGSSCRGSDSRRCKGNCSCRCGRSSRSHNSLLRRRPRMTGAVAVWLGCNGCWRCCHCCCRRARGIEQVGRVCAVPVKGVICVRILRRCGASSDASAVAQACFRRRAWCCDCSGRSSSRRTRVVIMFEHLGYGR